MNEPDLFSEEERPKTYQTTYPCGDSSVSEEHESRVTRSALWAAYGDALGWISELTNATGLNRRTGGAPLDKPIPWKRRIGGRSGVTVALPQGCYSDDSQLRLATGRAIRADGFDVEAFAKVELPIWLSYALGGGKSTNAAAVQLGRKNPTWWSNRFNRWTQSGGNGAAMRIQPHVWSARNPSDPDTFLPDVVRNSVCTHSHPTGLLGAVFHALCVAHATSVGNLPTPGDLRAIIKVAACLPDIIKRDTELGFWRIAFEQEAGSFDKAWAKAIEEVRQAVALVASCRNRISGTESYESIIDALKLRQTDRLGSGILTAVAAAGLGWCESRPSEAMRIAANAINTDTDTIATMAGAMLGLIADTDPPVEVLDNTVFKSEAKRLAKIACGESPEGYEYPDLLKWTAPKMRADALARSKDGTLHVCGLGRACELPDQPIYESGRFRWRWIKLEFGQTLLIKTRESPPDLDNDLVRTPILARSECNRKERSAPVTQQRRQRETPTDGKATPIEHDVPTVPTGTNDIRNVIRYVEKHIDDDLAVGKALRRVVRKGTIGQIAAFNAALVDLLRSSPGPRDVG